MVGDIPGSSVDDIPLSCLPLSCLSSQLVYSGYSKETLRQRDLQLSVLSAESLRENFFLGGVTLPLKDFNLKQETVGWYKLTEVPYF